MVDKFSSTSDLINVVIGSDKGVRFFTARIHNKLMDEKKATITGTDNLKNAFSVVTKNDAETIVGGDNGYLYNFREDKVADSKHQISKCAI